MAEIVTTPYERLAPVKKQQDTPYERLAPLEVRKRSLIEKTLNANPTILAARGVWRGLFGENLEFDKTLERGLGVSIISLNNQFGQQMNKLSNEDKVGIDGLDYKPSSTYDVNVALSDPGEDYKIGEKFLERSLTLIADSPFYLPGGILSYFTPGPAKAKLATGAFTATFVPESIRATYIEALTRGDVKNWEEWWNIYTEQGIIEGAKAATRVTGSLIAPSWLPKPYRTKMGNILANFGTSQVLGKVLNGEFDSADDMLIEAAFLSLYNQSNIPKKAGMITKEQIRTNQIRRKDTLKEISMNPDMMEDLLSLNLKEFRRNTEEFKRSLEPEKIAPNGFELIFDENAIKLTSKKPPIPFKYQFDTTELEASYIKSAMNKILPKEIKDKVKFADANVFVQDWVNRYDPIKRQVKTMGERGKWDVLDPEKTFLMETGNFGQADGQYKYGIRNYKTKEQVTESPQDFLNEIIKKEGSLGYQEFNTYISILDDIMSVKEGKKAKFTVEEQNAFLKNYTKKYEPYAKRYRKIVRAELDILYDGDLITKPLYDALKKRKDYAPAKVIFNGDEPGFKRTELNKIIHDKIGSEREIQKPTMSISENLYSFLNAVNKNKALKTYFEFIEDSKKVLKDKKDLAPEEISILETKKIKNITARKLSPDEIQKITLDLLEGETMDFTIFTKFNTQLPKNTITYFDKGKPVTYLVNDPLVFKAFKGLDPAEATLVKNIASSITTLKRDFAVLSPEFVGTAAIKDMGIAPIVSKVGLQPYDVALGILGQIKGRVFKTELWKNYMESRALGSDIIKSIETFKALDVDPRPLKNEISFKTFTVDAFNKGRYIFRDLIGTTAENATRFREFELAYNKAIKAGRTKSEAFDIAGFYAKDIIDFGRAGLYGRAWNRYSAFFNARIQSAAKFTQIISNPKTRRRAIDYGILYLTIPTIWAYLANYEDPDWINNVKDYEKHSGTQIKVDQSGREWFAHIPDAWGEWGIIFQQLPRRMMQWVTRNDPKAMKDFFTENVANTLFQVGGSILPDAVKPIVELSLNKSFFTGQNIFTNAEKRYVDPHVNNLYTSELSKFLAATATDTIKAIDGGILEEWDGFNPKTLDYLIKQTTTSIGTSTLNTMDYFLRKYGLVATPPQPVTGDFIRDLDRIPLIRKLTIENAPVYSSTPRKRFYNHYKKAQKYYNTSLDARRKGNMADYKKYKKLAQKYQYKRLQKVATAISRYKAIYDRVTMLPKDALTDEERVFRQETALRNLTKMAWRGIAIVEGNDVLPNYKKNKEQRAKSIAELLLNSNNKQ